MEITKSSLICSTCYTELLISIKFKYKCIKTENLIRSCLEDDSSQLVLSDVFSSKNKEDESVERKEEIIVIKVENNGECSNEDRVTEVTNKVSYLKVIFLCNTV